MFDINQIPRSGAYTQIVYIDSIYVYTILLYILSSYSVLKVYVYDLNHLTPYVYVKGLTKLLKSST